MFSKIEKVYKKESPYNKIIKTFIIVYVLSFMALWFFGLFKRPYFTLIFVFVQLHVIKIISEKEFNKKFTLKSIIKHDGQSELLHEIEEKEIKIMKKYLNENNINNNICITNIIDHYRILKSSKENHISLLELISLIVTILIPFINNNGFDIELLKKIAPYFITLIIMIAILYIFFEEIIILKKSLKGELYIYERLEEIFCIILCDNNKNKKINKTQKKNRRMH